MTCKVKACAFAEERDGLCVYHLRDRDAGNTFGVTANLNAKPTSQPVRGAPVANKCEREGCSYMAVSGDKFCLQHKPAKVITSDGSYTFVSMTDVPSNARYNEAAGNLFAAMKTCPANQAIKLSMKTFKKVTLVTAQRYALAAGLRIGVRIVGEHGYIWKMTEAEIAKVKIKGERLATARGKKKARGIRAAS